MLRRPSEAFPGHKIVPAPTEDLQAKSAAAVDAYDPELRAHYEAIGKATTPDSWSHDMDKKFHPQLREKLRAQLKVQGFDFR